MEGVLAEMGRERLMGSARCIDRCYEIQKITSSKHLGTKT